MRCVIRRIQWVIRYSIVILALAFALIECSGCGKARQEPETRPANPPGLEPEPYVAPSVIVPRQPEETMEVWSQDDLLGLVAHCGIRAPNYGMIPSWIYLKDAHTFLVNEDVRHGVMETTADYGGLVIRWRERDLFCLYNASDDAYCQSCEDQPTQDFGAPWGTP